jgi:hypothetical protein
MANSITFLSNPTPINEITADATLYFSDGGKHKSECKYFDSDGFAGFPDDAYSVADLRLDIQLGNTVEQDVTITMDIIMEDGRYLSEVVDPTVSETSMKMAYADFSKLTLITYAQKIVNPLFKKLQEYEKLAGSVTDDTCKSVIATKFTGLGDKETLAGMNPRNLASKIVEYCAKAEKSGKDLFKGLRAGTKEYNELYSAIVKNITMAIESNNENALAFFKKYPLDKNPHSRPNFNSHYDTEFPKLDRDSIASAQSKRSQQKRLPKNVDSPQEVITAFDRHMTDSRYKAEFTRAVKAKADIAKGTSKTFWNSVLSMLSSNTDTSGEK